MKRSTGLASLIDERHLAAAARPLSKATTLPATAFTSPAVFQLETERIFRKEWLCVGRADQVPDPGDYFTLDLLGDKLVVVRGSDAEARVLSRVCRHRAAEVAQGAGNTRSFQCPYHSWTYRLDGELVGAPHMEGVEAFEKAECGLPQIRSEIWEGWIFVNFDAEADSLSSQLESLTQIFRNYRMSEMVCASELVFDSPFNWKVLVDNFMEAYHHIAIHRDTFEPIYPGALSHSPDTDGPYSVLVMPEKPGLDRSEHAPTGAMRPFGTLAESEKNRLIVAAVFPFHLFAPTAESLTWYHVVPHSHDHFTLRIFSCFPAEVLDDPSNAPAVDGMKALLDVVHREDIVACEAVWSGMADRSFESGRLSLLEKPIWQFNQWWMERMQSGD